METKIAENITKQAEAAQTTDKEAVEQKSSQVSEQAQALADQTAAAAAKAAADAKAKIAEVNRKLADLPKEIDKKIDELKDTLDSLLGKKLPKAADPNNIDFDVDTVMKPLKAVLNPVLGAIGPVEAVVGKVPVLGDLMGLMSGMASNSSPTSLTKEEIKKLVPKPPEMPDTLMNSLKGIIEDVEAFCKKLPMLLIDILFQMMAVIPGLFDMIAGIIGVPSIPFPLNLVTQMPSLMPKINKLVTELPTQVKQLVEGVIRQKYAESMALAVPAPPTLDAEAAAKKAAAKAAEKAKETTSKSTTSSSSSGSSESSSSTQSSIPQVSKDVPASQQTAPGGSEIAPTPSIQQPEPKAPISDEKPAVEKYYLCLQLGDGYYNVYGRPNSDGQELKTEVGKIVYNEIKNTVNLKWEQLYDEVDNKSVKVYMVIPNDIGYSTKEEAKSFFQGIVDKVKSADKCKLEEITTRTKYNQNCILDYNMNKKSFFGLF